MDQALVYKSGAILIKDKKALVLRDKDEDTFFTPGGKIDPGETPEQTIIRELSEEIRITVAPDDLEEFGTFVHPMGTDQSKTLNMTVFVIHKWTGDVNINNEIDELKWIDTTNAGETKLGSIFKEEILPRLKEKNIIN